MSLRAINDVQILLNEHQEKPHVIDTGNCKATEMKFNGQSSPF